MLSAPAPIAMSASPSRMLCEAETIACKPDPHSRFSVRAGASCVTPALIAQTRARYMSFASVWITLPKTTCSTSSPFTWARESASRTTWAPRSVGGTSLSPPPKSPTAVRTAETTMTSRCMMPSSGCCRALACRGREGKEAPAFRRCNRRVRKLTSRAIR